MRAYWMTFSATVVVLGVLSGCEEDPTASDACLRMVKSYKDAIAACPDSFACYNRTDSQNLEPCFSGEDYAADEASRIYFVNEIGQVSDNEIEDACAVLTEEGAEVNDDKQNDIDRCVDLTKQAFCDDSRFFERFTSLGCNEMIGGVVEGIVHVSYAGGP